MSEMYFKQEDIDIDKVTRTAQLITFALMTGIIIFAVIAFAMKPVPPIQEKSLHMNVTLGFAVLLVILFFVVPRVVVGNALGMIAAGKTGVGEGPLSSTESGRLLSLYQVKVIIGFALLEWAAFLGCMPLLVEGHEIALASPVAVLVLMATFFPNKGRVRDFAEMQRSQLEGMRFEEENR